jgi:hypothetical protein
MAEGQRKEEFMPRFRKRPVVIEATQWRPGTEIEGVEIRRTGAYETAHIETLEGLMAVSDGDWVITGVNGERYPCKPDIFAKTYLPADEPSEDDARVIRLLEALDAGRGEIERLKALVSSLNEGYAQCIVAREDATLHVARLEGELRAADAPHALQREAYEWSRATFGAVEPQGPLNHLRREIDETIAAYEEGGADAALAEFADCYLLLNDALSRAGLTVADLFGAARRKLEINKRREWGAVNAEGFAEHVREPATAPAEGAGEE